MVPERGLKLCSILGKYSYRINLLAEMPVIPNFIIMIRLNLFETHLPLGPRNLMVNNKEN